MRRFLLVLTVFGASASAQSAAQPQADIGGFGGKLLIVGDTDAFWKEWEKPDTPHIVTTSTVTVSRPAYGMIVFHGCRPASDGNCNVTAHFSIITPDGSSYDDPVSGQAWGGPPAPGSNLLASLSSIGFRLEPRDKIGRYQINAVLTDNVARKSVTVSDYVVAEPELGPEKAQPAT